MALSRVVSEVFNVESVVTLKSGERSLKVIARGTICVWFPISVLQ